MKFVKILSFAAGLSVLLSGLTPVTVNALSTASMTLSGTTNTNGSFSVVVYENTGSDTVTGANVELSFSQAVSGISYDYSVGPFSAVTPSGKHNAYGTVTGTNPVARVSFKLANPGTVTASVNGNSYLKHAEGSTIESFTINRGSANFTYSAPVTPSNPDNGSGSDNGGSTGGSTGGASNGSSNTTTNAVASDTTASTDETKAEVKDANTTKSDTSKKKSDDKKKDDAKDTSEKSGNKTWLWLAIILIIAVAAYLATRRRPVSDEAEQAGTKASDASDKNKGKK